MLWSYLAEFQAEMHSFAKILSYNIQGLIIVKQRKPLHFYIICKYRNKKRTESATIWQLKSVCRQRTGPFWEWRQTDTNRGLGTWKSLGLAGIQGESGPVVRCMGPIQLRGGGGSGMTGINSLWLRQLPRLLRRIKQWNVTGSVFRGTVSLVTAHTKEMLMIALSCISLKNSEKAFPTRQTSFLGKNHQSLIFKGDLSSSALSSIL